jgi:hypothetical protein
MEARITKTIQARTWYSVKSTVKIGPGFLHKAGIGRFLIPHPPVVNWLLRQGLTKDARLTLSFTHEFGHFQTAPLAVLYTAVNFTAIIASGHLNLDRIVLVFISTHAAWEMMSEIITIMSDVQFYRKSYKRIPILPRIVFWIFTGALATVGWIIVIL